MAQNQNTNRKKTWITGTVAVGLGAFTLFNASSVASGSPLDEFVLYGIGSQSGSLVRYQFSDDTLTTVGPISDGTTTLTGIQASAYVPRNTNIFTFWTDPSDSQTKLVYVNATTGQATIVGQPLGTGSVTAAVATMPTPNTSTLAADEKTPIADTTQYGIYAIKEVDPIPFNIVSYDVEKDDSQLVKFETPTSVEGLGDDGADETDTFQISVSGGSTSVTVETKAAGNVATNVLNGVGSEVLDSGGFRIRLISIDGANYEFTVTSENTPHALSHIEFDFGSSATVTSPSTASTVDISRTDTGPVAHLISVDPRNGLYTEIVPLSRVYDGLAATSAQMFYGTYEGELYAIDPATGTETWIGTLPYSQNVEAFETAGNSFYGFSDVDDQLRAIDPTTGQIIGADISTGITDLGSLTLIRLADEPQEKNTFD